MAAHFLLPAKMDALFAGVLVACVWRRAEIPGTVRANVRLVLAGAGITAATALIGLATQSPRDFGGGADLLVHRLLVDRYDLPLPDAERAALELATAETPTPELGGYRRLRDLSAA